MFGNFTTEDLDKIIAQGGGFGRAAGYLKSIAPEYRKAAYVEGELIALAIGGKMADGVYEAVKNVRNGNTAFLYTKANLGMYNRENQHGVNETPRTNIHRTPL